MLRKTTSQKPARIQKHSRRKKTQGVMSPAVAGSQLQIAPDQATAAGRIEARLKSAAKEAFESMGED